MLIYCFQKRGDTVSRHNSFDNETDGQLTIADYFDPPERMVAVSNIFARARKQMSLAEQKTFVLALSQLEWTKAPEEQSNIVHLNNKTLQSILGYQSDSTDISQHIWDAIKMLSPHSYIEIADKDRGFYTSGAVVATITKRRGTNYVRVKFEEDYFSLFTGLGNRYITMWSADIFRMTRKRSVQFYELLRQMSFDKYAVASNVYSFGWGIKALKEMFDIPKEGKGSYTDNSGHFDRYNFEKYVIDPICDDLAKCQMIQLIIQSNGKAYEKVKKGNRVQGYRFYWTLTQRPGVADAHEVKKIADRVDKNPQVLKVAKDLLKSKKSSKRKTGKENMNRFNNFQQRDYDFKSLEKALIKKQQKKNDNDSE